MPITPEFVLSQDDEMCYVKIRVPYVRISDMEFIVDGTSFTFYCKPYLLKLTLPGRVVDDEEKPASGKYDLEDRNGTVTVSLYKEKKSEDFKDLDLITKLMQTSHVKREPGYYDGYRGIKGPPTIEIMESATFVSGSSSSRAAPAAAAAAAAPDDAGNVDGVNGATTTTSSAEKRVSGGASKETEEGEVTVEDGAAAGGGARAAAATASISSTLRLGETPYGFNGQYSHVLTGLSTEFPGLTKVPAPVENVSLETRRAMRLKAENEAFDEERYMCDFVGIEEDPIYAAAMSYQSLPSPDDNNDAGGGAAAAAPAVKWTEAETTALRQLPNKEYLIEEKSAEERRVLCGLVDLLFAYAYDRRVTQGDANVESAWAIWILSSSLSWFDVFDDVETALKAATHRSLAFPYFRHWAFTTQVLRDLARVFRSGRRAVLRWLLEVRTIFKTDEQRYLVNKMYVDDYCVWIQCVSEDSLRALSRDIDRALPKLLDKKASVRWNLEGFETYILEACKELEVGDGGGDNVDGKVGAAEGADRNDDEDDDSSSCSGSSSSSDESHSSDDDDDDDDDDDEKEEGREAKEKTLNEAETETPRVDSVDNGGIPVMSRDGTLDRAAPSDTARATTGRVGSSPSTVRPLIEVLESLEF